MSDPRYIAALTCCECGSQLGRDDAGDPTLIELYADPTCWSCHEAFCAAEDAERAEFAEQCWAAARASLEDAGDGWARTDHEPLPWGTEVAS